MTYRTRACDMTVLVVLLSLFLQPVVSALPLPVLASPQASPGGTVRVAYLYRQDAQTAAEFQDLLAPAGYALTPLTLEERPPLRQFLPVVSVGAAPAARIPARPVAPTAVDVSAYDLFIIADDTEGLWDAQAGLAQAIADSDKAVIALGRGGHEFLGALGLPNGAPNGILQTGHTVFATDFGQSRPFYQEPHVVPLAGDESVQVLTAPGLAVAIPLPDPVPEGIRVAGFTPTGPYPLVLADDRFLLWGFVGGPGAMMDAGRALFLNALWFRAGDLALPIEGAGFVPAPGFDQEFLDALFAGGVPLHALAQLDHIPDPAEREMLAARGVTLQPFLAGTFYAVLVDPTFNPDDPFLVAMIRWLGAATPNLKVDPEVLNGGALQAGGIDTLLVTFFDDVGPEQAAEVLSQYTEEFTYFVDRVWRVPYSLSLIDALSREERVRWIGAGPPPPLDTNDGARSATGTDTVQNAVIPAAGAPTYLGLDGSGVVVAQFERRPDATHQDLTGRVSSGGNAHAITSSHATHVAGIMIGSGAQSSSSGGTNRQWRGHAPAATLVSERYGTDTGTGQAFTDFFSDAIRNFDAEVSNHSYVMTFGRYDGIATAIDRIVRGSATDSSGNSVPARLAVWAAANQGVRAQYNNEEGFYSIYAPAKNVLTVGSIDSNDMGLSMFSSKGPTFDGRIKPDVVAPGCQNGGDGGITSTELGGGYIVKCGTSMAAPATAGVIALMLEQYHRTFGPGTTPRPSTLKAILVNTATDLTHTAADGSDQNDPDLCRNQGPGGTPLGPSDPLDADCWIPYGPGPDFATGYGAINAVRAVNAVRGKMFLEDSLSPTDTVDEFTFAVGPGRSELRVTLAWDDEPGDASLAATTNQLVNDLDLRLIAPDGTVHFPFVLDPLPASANLGNGDLDPIDQDDVDDARRDDNDRDNVEQVVVQNPAAGTWTVRVTVEGGFPTGQAQPYSLAGDFRTFTIVEPTTGNPVDAGSKNDPATFLVMLEADQPLATGAPDTQSTFQDAEAGDFQVSIDGTAATIVSGLPVGDQFWLMVRPQSGVYDPDYYALQVTWTGYGTAQQADAVYFLKRRVADRVIIIDHSGSMADYDKMQAAKNAGRLFVDQALADDRVAVVGFSTNASTAYAIKVVSAGSNPPELTNAKNAIDSLNPTNATAIGKGLLQGKGEIDTAGGSAEIWRMVLLSDGMENIPPYYDTAAVKGVIQPTSIVVDTVAVGPSNAGHHALLEQIASDNSGTSYHVTETGFGSTLARTGAPATPPSEWTWMSTLENRLADQYKAIAEDIRREQRLWQVAGDISREDQRHDFDVRVEEGLASITFAVNWTTPAASLRMELRSPSGRLYNPGDPDVTYRSDPTHETWIIANPEPGFWSVGILSFKAATEYVAWLSAHTRVNFRLLIGTPPTQRVAGDPVHIVAVLDDGKPIKGADVIAQVRGPDDRTWVDELRLYDDGAHGDGRAGDGIYANWYLQGAMPGNYGVRARAEGLSSLGAPFLRYANRTFHLRPRALYVHDGDLELARQYEDLLEANGWAVDVSRVGGVPRLDASRYQLIIVGPETGSGSQWGTREAFQAMVQYKVPVLGLNEGGYAFFGRDYLGLDIGYPHGAHGTGSQVIWNRGGESIWRYPYDLTPLPAGPLTLYQNATAAVDIFLNAQEPPGVQVYGWNPSDRRYADLAREDSQYILWAFAGGPNEMTDTGQQLFVNTAYFAAFGNRP